MDGINKKQEPGVRPHPWIVSRDSNLLTPDLHDFSDLVGSEEFAGQLRRIAAVAAIVLVCTLATEHFVSTSLARADVASAPVDFLGVDAPLP